MHRSHIHWLPLFLLVVLACVGCSDRAALALTPTPMPAPTDSAPATVPITESRTMTPNANNAALIDPASINGIEAITEITSYRFTLTTLTYAANSSDASEMGSSGFTARGAVVKEPEAMALLVRLIDYQGATGEFGQNIGYRTVDGRHYAMQQDMWGEITDAQGNDMSEVAVFSTEEIRDALSGMTLVGVEEVGSRAALHYQGGVESMDALSEESIASRLDQVESAQFDVWIDQELNFIARIRLTAEGTGTPSRPNLPGRIETDMTYYAINDSITVLAPNENGDFVPQDLLSPESVAEITSYRFTHSKVTEGAAFSTTGSEVLAGASGKRPLCRRIVAAIWK